MTQNVIMCVLNCECFVFYYYVYIFVCDSKIGVNIFPRKKKRRDCFVSRKDAMTTPVPRPVLLYF